MTQTELEARAPLEPCADPVSSPVQSHRIHHFFDPATGVFIGSFSGREEHVAGNVPEGAGVHVTDSPIDHSSQRLCLETGALLPYVRATPDDEAGAAARAERDRRLAASDWVVTRAVEALMPVPPKWRAYRQALRDLTTAPGFPRTHSWPIPPAPT